VTSEPSAATAGGRPGRAAVLRRWLEWVVRALSLLVIGCWALIAAVHVDDTYAFDHTSGAWLALARYASGGVFYPALFDGSSFGGTRFMPLQFVAHAGVAKITGEYLVSGKVLAYTSAVVLFVLTFVVARRMSRSATVAFGLVAAVLVTPAGLLAATSVRGDALPVALQLAALMIATRSSRLASAAAGGLCAVAILSKSTAAWALIAITAWLIVHERRRVLDFLGAFGALLVGGLALFELLSHGRMTDNLFGFPTAGTGRISAIPLDATHKFVDYGQRYADAMWILVPFALAAVIVAAARRRWTMYESAFVVALALLLVEFGDIGVSWNHLIDIEVLTAVLVAKVYGESDGVRDVVATLVLAAIAWGVAASFQLAERRDVADAMRAVAGRGPSYDPRPLATELRHDDAILSEDPYISVSRDEDPKVLDPFMLLRILRDHPAWEDGLVGDIERGKFTKVVVLRPIAAKRRWWRDYHFGTRVVTAIERHYRLNAHIGRYWLYVPRARSGASSG
jgi:hypothetical protein